MVYLNVIYLFIHSLSSITTFSGGQTDFPQINIEFKTSDYYFEAKYDPPSLQDMTGKDKFQ